MMVLACVVVFFTTYALILPALTMEKNAYCGMKEHTHSASCYEQKLICGKEEGRKEGHAHTEQCYETERTLVCQTQEREGHTHTEECRKTEQILTCDQEENEEHTHAEGCYTEQTEVICGMEEQEGHIHTEACYQAETKLICGTEECAATEHKHDKDCYEKKMVCKKEEHQHNTDCYADRQADTESAGVWEKTLPSALSGDWRKDVTAVAESQLGYRESTQNYQVTESGETKGYTRYGAWYGDPYGDWCAMFVSFCLHYAEIPSSAVPYEAGCQRWIAALQQKGIYEAAGGAYEPKQGDLIFFDWEGDGVSDHVGLVKAISGGGGVHHNHRRKLQ